MVDSANILRRILRALDDESGTTSGETVYGVPSGDTYRWVLPQSRSATLSVLRSWRPYNLPSRLKWTVLQTLVGILGVKRTPGLRAIGALPPPSSQIVQNLCGCDTAGAHAVFYIGTPGPQRKAVCHIVSEAGTVLAVLKIPLEDGAKVSIAREARMLCALEECGPDLNLPRLLGEDPERGTAAQTWMQGRPVGRSFTSAHGALLTSLRGVDEFELGAHISRLRQRAERATKFLPDMALLMGRIDSLDANLTGPRVWQHGDFTPWNLRLTDSGLGLFDWEDGTKDGLPVWDMAHFFAMQAQLFDGAPEPFEAMQADGNFQHYLSDMSLTDQQGIELFRFYCLGQGVTAFETGLDDLGHILFGCVEPRGGEL